MSIIMESSPNGDIMGLNVKVNGGFPESVMMNGDIETEDNQRALLVDWLNGTFPHLNLPAKASDDDLRACLQDGTILCMILKRLKFVSAKEASECDPSSISRIENVKRFLETMDKIGIPRFEPSDLEKGSMQPVIECLLRIKGRLTPIRNIDTLTKSASFRGDGSKTSPIFGEEKRKSLPESPAQEKRKSLPESPGQRTLRSTFMPDPSAALIHHAGQKFHEVFQMKQGRYSDLPATKLSEMMKPNSLDNAPTQSLLSVVNGILDESVEKKNGEIPHRVALLLRKVVQEIERRISTQAEHLRTQNNLFKTREEKYQSRIRVLETLAAGTGDENEIVMKQLKQIKSEKSKVEEKKIVVQEDVVKLATENDQSNLRISGLKNELEMEKKKYEEDVAKLRRDKELLDKESSVLKQELEMTKRTCMQLEIETKGSAADLGDRLKELESLLTESKNKVKELESLLAESRNKVKELEANSETRRKNWIQKENICQSVMEFQLGALRELRFSSDFIKQELSKVQRSYTDEFFSIGKKLKFITNAAENYDEVLAENRKIYNELQELKGNIRVYCRVRPFMPGQAKKQSSIEHIGDNGELVVTNPSKPGKEGQKMFKFNKVYGPTCTQADVFEDTKPLIRSVLDGYNVCIFAYGQTGSGKTYTMTGPDNASEENWGVNYRALNDLFKISQNRNTSITYEVGVQMVEIYNEQVRDLLSSDGGTPKKLGILSTTQANGLAVPDATMQPVRATSDVMELMEIGLKNRAKGATAMNERSSRSHSVVTIHVRGKDLKSSTPVHGNLHLVDLAGSERVDRSEVTGDRLKEAQHINKSLSALGDVIFALAQKSSHVPYRNSKLTQVLQSSLGGHAKTLMFVQLNPDAVSYSESLSTLKFAERVSGVELGAAKSSKDGRDVRELMEQVASLKDTISKKDEEIERLQLLKDLKNVYPNGEKRSAHSSSNSSLSVGTAPDESLELCLDDDTKHSIQSHSATSSARNSPKSSARTSPNLQKAHSRTTPVSVLKDLKKASSAAISTIKKNTVGSSTASSSSKAATSKTNSSKPRRFL